MIANAKERWSALSGREKGFVAVMLVLLAGVLLWLGVVRPVTRGLDAARGRQAAALDRYAAIKARVDALKSLAGNRPPRIDAPLAQLIGSSAAERGFTLERNQDLGNGRVSVAVGSGRPAAVFGWIAELEASGVRVETLSARPDGPDVIGLTATLRAPQ